MSSKHTTLSLVNLSGVDISSVDVSNVDAYDWDYSPPERTKPYRPDLNFTGPLASGDARCEREEINARANGVNFTLTCRFADGSRLEIPVDQGDALAKQDGIYGRATSSGAAGRNVYRVTGQDKETHTQAFYLYPKALPDHSDWMGRLLRNKPGVLLNHITMPGSHDAGMYVDNSDDVKLNAAQNGGGEWALTQHLPMRDQLRAGARYFDIRVYHDRNGVLWTYHGQFKGAVFYGAFGGKLTEILGDVKAFLDGPGASEAVFLKITPYDGAADLPKTIGEIRAKLASHLYTAAHDPSFAVTRLADLKGKVVVAFDPLFHGLLDPNQGLFPYRECGNEDGTLRQVTGGGLKVYDVYADSNSFEHMKRDQDKKLTAHGGHGKSYLFLLSWTVTGETGGILDLELLSRCANPQLPRKLRALARGNKLPNIVHLDHLDAYLCGAIIALNDPVLAVAPPSPGGAPVVA